MKNYVVYLVQYVKPFVINAKNEDEARKIVGAGIAKKENKYSLVEKTIHSVRDSNQNWFKNFIQDNF